MFSELFSKIQLKDPKALEFFQNVSVDAVMAQTFNNNNNNNTYIALIRMRSKRFTSIVLQYDLEI